MESRSCDFKHYMVYLYETLHSSPLRNTTWFTSTKHYMVHIYETLHGSHLRNTTWFTSTKHYMVHIYETLFGNTINTGNTLGPIIDTQKTKLYVVRAVIIFSFLEEQTRRPRPTISAIYAWNRFLKNTRTYITLFWRYNQIKLNWVVVCYV